MRDNINKVSERGARLDSLQDKTDNLATSAQGFRRGANRVRKQMWWKDMKMRMCLIVGIIILLIVIIVPSGKLHDHLSSLQFADRSSRCNKTLKYTYPNYLIPRRGRGRLSIAMATCRGAIPALDDIGSVSLRSWRIGSDGMASFLVFFCIRTIGLWQWDAFAIPPSGRTCSLIPEVGAWHGR